MVWSEGEVAMNARGAARAQSPGLKLVSVI